MQTRTLFNKRVSRLWIAGALLLQAIVVVVRFPASAPMRQNPEPFTERTAETQPRRVHQTPQSVFDSETYYRTIIENNLFRPLGWTPPRPIEPYRLLGTILPIDANTPPQAILQSTAGNPQTYIVSIGDKLDASTSLVSIENKQVTLSHNGQQRTLHLSIGF